MCNCDLLCDIGTDHAYLPISLIQNCKLKYTVLTDINRDPIKKAERNMVRHLGQDILSRSEFLQGRGILALDKSEYIKMRHDLKTTIVVAGMGANLIQEILFEGKKYLTEEVDVVVQPMTKPHELLKWFYENGYDILDHILVKEDRRFYNVIKVRRTGIKVPFELKDIYVGSMLIKKNDPHLKEYLEKKAALYAKIIDNRKRSYNRNPNEFGRVYEEICRLLKEM